MSDHTRVGMITPSLNTVLEPVTYALLADLPDVTAHFSRVRGDPDFAGRGLGGPVCR